MGRALVPILAVSYLVLAAVLWALGLLLGWNPVHLAAYSLLGLIPFSLVYAGAKLLAARKEKAFEAKIAEGATGAGASELQGQFQKGLKLIRESAYNRTALTTLPWYLIIGAPGSGKSTAIRESGLTFPSVGQGLRSYRGIGGTRNCDWWITDEAFFLDTAGRYTTRPDDREEWFAFLDMVKRHRKHMPLNGILVTVSALDLIKKDEAAMEAHAQIIRDRIEEVATRLEVRLPVYLLFTKCDLISGFKNFFGGLSGGEKDQVLGATFSWPPPDGGDDAQRFGDEIARLRPGLATHRLKVVARAEGDGGDAVKSVRFPSQLARVTGFMQHFVGSLFRTGRIREVAGLRGFYLTSGTQPGAENTPAGGQAVQAGGPATSEPPKPAAAAPPSFEGSIFVAPSGSPSGGFGGDPENRSSGIFLRNLFAKVVIPDAGLVRRSLARIRRQRVLALACRIGCPILGLVLAVWVVVGYSTSLAITGQAEDLIERMRDDRRAGIEGLALRIQRLDSMRGLMDRIEREDPPGLEGLRADLAVSYYRHLSEIVLRPLAADLAAELIAADGAQASDLRRAYELYLAYKTLGGEVPEADGGIEAVARTLRQDQRWLRQLGEVDEETRRVAERQLEYLVGHPDDAGTWAVVLDQDLVERMQARLADSLLIQQGYDQVLASLAGARPAITRDTLITGSYRDALINPGELPGIFTHDAWNGVVEARLESESEQLERRFDELGKPMARAAILQRLTALFRNDFDRAWLEFIRDTRVAPSRNLREAGRKLGVIAGPQSPWHELLKAAWRQAAFNFDEGILGEDIEQSMGWFEPVISQLKELDQAVQRFEGATDFGRRSEDLERIGALARTVEDTRLAIAAALRDISEPRLQAAVRASAEAVLASVYEALGAEVAAEQNDLWRDQVRRPFERDMAGRYPFAEAEAEVPLGLFAAFFNPVSGAISRRVAAVDSLRAIKALDRGLLEVTRDYERSAKRVADIHAVFFAGGGETPKLEFVAALKQRQGVKDMALTVGQKRFALYDSPTPRTDFTWGDAIDPGARIAVSIPGDHWLQIAHPGAWGLLRLFRDAEVGRAGAGGWDLIWTIESAALGESARFRAGAHLMGRPLDVLFDQRDLLLRFTCPERVAP